jgi:hypothetical protein
LAARNKLGLTHPQLALAAGVGVRFIVELEACQPTVRLETLLKVLHALGGKLASRPEVKGNLLSPLTANSWSMGENMQANAVTDALRMAWFRRCPPLLLFKSSLAPFLRCPFSSFVKMLSLVVACWL